MKKQLKKLCNSDLNKLKDLKGIRTFEADNDLIKKNEVPPVAIIIVKGEANILKQDSEFLKVNPGYALGIEEMKENKPSSLNLRAKRNLKAILLEKCDLSDGSPLKPMLDQIFKAA